MGNNKFSLSVSGIKKQAVAKDASKKCDGF